MTLRKALVNICRVLVGILFIFSGIIKAIDPIGFAYKNIEYFEILHLDFLKSIALGISFFMCVFEIFLGAYLLLGVYRKFTVWMTLLMTLFFTFLTGYTAIGNWLKDHPEAGFTHWAANTFHFKPENIAYMKDCGCFGDAVQLNPWESFLKNIVLLVLIFVLIPNWRLIQPVFKRRIRHALALVAVIATFLFTFFNYYFEPVVDFRPYAVGKDLKKQMEVPPGSPRDSIASTFVYSKNGKEFYFSMDDLMKIDSTYTYVRRDDKVVREGVRPAIQDFAIYDRNGQDRTQEFLSQPGYRLMIVQYDLEKSNLRAQSKVNALISELMKEGEVKIWALTASSMQLVDVYRQKNQVPYDFYQVDGTVLKTIVRSNTGLLLLKDNLVVAKWPSTWLPSKEDIYRRMK